MASFRTCLPTTLELDERWRIGLTEITYPRKISKIRLWTFDFYVDGTNWIKKYKFGKGVYTDLEQVVEEIHRSIHRARGVWNKEASKKNFSWQNDLEGKFGLNYPETVRFADMSPNLFHILGIKRLEAPRKHAPEYHDMLSYFPVDFHHWHQVYVNGDFLEQQLVGNSRAPLLNTFSLFNPQQMPPKEENDKPGGFFGYGACFFMSFPNPTFRNVAKKNLIDMAVEPSTETGDLIPFVVVAPTSLNLVSKKIE